MNNDGQWLKVNGVEKRWIISINIDTVVNHGGEWWVMVIATYSMVECRFKLLSTLAKLEQTDLHVWQCEFGKILGIWLQQQCRGEPMALGFHRRDELCLRGVDYLECGEWSGGICSELFGVSRAIQKGNSIRNYQEVCYTPLFVLISYLS